jgi:hypothetical protein
MQVWYVRDSSTDRNEIAENTSAMEDVRFQPIRSQIDRDREREKCTTYPVIASTDLLRIHNAKVKYFTGIHNTLRKSL